MRSAGKFSFIFFIFFFSPGCFVLVSLIVAVTAAAICELEQFRLAEASWKEQEFNQIVKVLKRREEEEVNEDFSTAILLLEFKQSSNNTWMVKMHVHVNHRQPARRTVKTARKTKRINKPAKKVKTLKQTATGERAVG